ncbi:MAG: VWA domain-containing protein [Bauldia sp.]
MAIILDASGSMLQRLGDRRRIDIAKDVLSTLGAEILPDGLPVALRVFGHDRPESCEQELFLPLAPLDRAAFAAAVERVQSVNLARTPIAASLRAAAGDLADAAGSRIIVLITDGEETCGGDPLAEIAALRAEGVEVRLNIVGFAIGDPATRALFETWAEAGAGAYFDAGDQAALGAAIEQATALPFVVLDAAGVEMAAGVVGGDPVPLPPGSYRLRVGDGPEQVVVIREGEEQRTVAGVP